ncbi:hypothetical protein GIB67_040108 [Kingdonia uniflora]|uniref:C3H1-type domain-containing protein n=1 Tax=Kingdonia uniflora TaxID=39325 RepID=A0A7J7MUT1_9MAGN|nr:hypothetical protein GIB67_040108 [Kingdonia uniflora]
MCGGPDDLQSKESKPNSLNNMNHLTVETEDSFSSLLELSANNDVEGFRRSIERDVSAVDEIGRWYGRQKGSKQMVLEDRTPLMVAATYGSTDVLKLILSLSEADVNRSCDPDKTTALHCAASGGSVNAVDVVKLLLVSGADPNAVDASGCRPADVIVVSPKLPNVKIVLQELLTADHILRISISTSSSNSPPLSLSPNNESPSSATDSTSSPIMKFNEKKEYPTDPSLPDIRNSNYVTDEFRMFSFKVKPCSRAYSHDWTECPFVHPGENARRRDPRKFHYSCVPCPDFRKGACRRGDLCEYAHGVFECWLHPAQYRTRLCKDGTSCMRRVCFFAHTPEELRPLYVSTGSAVPSPRSSASNTATAMELAAAMSLLPNSPSSVSLMSPSLFTPPMSPSSNNISHSSLPWPQPNVPTLNLPGSNLQSSRLRSSLNARDMISEEYNLISDYEAQSQQQQQLFHELSSFSQRGGLNSPSLSHRPIRTKSLTPSNLDDLFTAEISSSPRYVDQAFGSSALFSPSHKSAMLNQFQLQQSMLSPINTNTFSPKNVDHPFMQPSFGSGVSSPGRMSPRTMDPISPMSARMSMLSQREKHQQMQMRSLSSRELGSSSAGFMGSPPVNSWTRWGSPTGKLDWAVQGDELTRSQRTMSSCELGINGEEPDVSWVQSLVKETPPEIIENAPTSNLEEGMNSKSQTEASLDYSVLGAWIEQMQLDQQLVA